MLQKQHTLSSKAGTKVLERNGLHKTARGPSEGLGLMIWRQSYALVENGTDLSNKSSFPSMRSKWPELDKLRLPTKRLCPASTKLLKSIAKDPSTIRKHYLQHKETVIDDHLRFVVKHNS